MRVCEQKYSSRNVSVAAETVTMVAMVAVAPLWTSSGPIAVMPAWTVSE